MRWSSVFSLAFLALIVAVAVQAAAFASPMSLSAPAPAAEHAAVAPGTQTEAKGFPDAASVALTRQLVEAERKASILEARIEMEDAGYARLEIILAAFGVLITVLVVGFGIATYQSAANAARAELADVRERVEDLQREAEAASVKSVDAAKSADSAAASARTSAEQARTHELAAEQDSAKIRDVAALAERQMRSLTSSGSLDLSADERQTVEDAAREVAEKAERDWTANDFKVKILEAGARRDWKEVRRLARGMEFLFGSDADLKAYALFQEARAYEDEGDHTQAVASYEDVARQLEGVDTLSVRRIVARALVNKSIVCGCLTRNAEAESVASDVIERFQGNESDGIQSQVAKAMVNRGVMLGRLGRQNDEEEMYRTVISRYHESNNPVIQAQVVLAKVNLAITREIESNFPKNLTGIDEVIDSFSHSDHEELKAAVDASVFIKAELLAKMGKVTSAIAALEAWRLRLGALDCNKILSSNAFASIMSRPSFKRYLKKHGCVRE
jgi:tetratricopeptide (TPR) repeat protein